MIGSEVKRNYEFSCFFVCGNRTPWRAGHGGRDQHSASRRALSRRAARSSSRRPPFLLATMTDVLWQSYRGTFCRLGRKRGCVLLFFRLCIVRSRAEWQRRRRSRRGVSRRRSGTACPPRLRQLLAQLALHTFLLITVNQKVRGRHIH